jgi:hypothetical protein
MVGVSICSGVGVGVGSGVCSGVVVGEVGGTSCEGCCGVQLVKTNKRQNTNRVQISSFFIIEII